MPDHPSMDFIPELEHSLETAQRGFAEYNAAAFPARTPQFFALELNGEAGEIANKEKKIWKGRDIPLPELADEAADVLIAVINYANSRGIDLAQAVGIKLREIERRRRDDLENGRNI